ncbi:MAG: heme NO-binding protein [Nitrospiraceae bacterium]|nr:heme NO-binding protein [Nitrospiraceae bacterium]
MKGIVNKGIQEFVETVHGKDVWASVKARADCKPPFFAIGQDYPDESSIALLDAASEELDCPREQVMMACGEFIVLNTLKQHYPTYFALAGSSPRELLLHMNRVHEQVTRSIMNATPPRFEFEELDDGRLLMHYESHRGLCSMLHGLILGVGRSFDQNLQVRETHCRRKGDDRCTMEITFP